MKHGAKNRSNTKKILNNNNVHTHARTHTHTYVCVCVCVRARARAPRVFMCKGRKFPSPGQSELIVALLAETN